MPEYWLAVQRATGVNSSERLGATAKRWGLTQRQTMVLSCLVEGQANKQIASQLACSESTIELHVSAILQKSECQSRSEVVAKFWGSLGR
jgi:DNA-binding NarL/FixJ family response regulator